MLNESAELHPGMHQFGPFSPTQCTVLHKAYLFPLAAFSEANSDLNPPATFFRYFFVQRPAAVSGGLEPEPLLNHSTAPMQETVYNHVMSQFLSLLHMLQFSV